MAGTLSAERFKPKNSAGRNLPVAVAVGVGLGALVIAAVLSGPLGWYLLVSAAVGLATWEVTTRLMEADYLISRPVLIIGGQFLVWLTWPWGVGGMAASYVAVALVVMYGRLFVQVDSARARNYVRDVAISLFVLTWIPMFGAFAALISRIDSDFAAAPFFIVTFMACVVASDTGGYIAGVCFGSHPMAPAVSPKKSWEGFAGSLIGGALVGLLCVVFLLEQPWWLGVAMGLLMAVCATLGDLVESQFKRDLGIKDMSALLPGHGGMMDRLDGLLPAAMVTWLLLSLVTQGLS
ncbi:MULTISPECIES: phosphatidate cytidylyltransferase [unclassified Corynebacterium]|uniref:phosphatidate cytidylyltransferase n=1 Tax=unclassified Corynebacterium TaxID=2624378 RepID=UPI0029CA248F|nr:MULTISPECIES: phosphatidate cytidylyltransferase [unclassified Corynebacterium]WPF65325.1 phosphatidate cytidylyltransferase [Corynebacterium sp. 22KM0430]WPF67820.1 phosphatidate cytidylyltransferase [Corynebacterium sp. 21KM1197]